MNLQDSENHRMKDTWDNMHRAPQSKEEMEEYVGFLYRIQERDTRKIYIGIKQFWKTIKRKPLKGKKRRRICKVESDWRTYKTSSLIMQEKLEKNPDNYYCEICCLCKSKTELKAREARAQLNYYLSGEWDTLYNEVINLRLRIR